MDDGTGIRVPTAYAGPIVRYVSTTELAKQLAYRNVDDERLGVVCDSATELIDEWCGRTEQFDPIPATIHNVALALAVDLWKQPDATFGIMGMGETGLVRVARDLVMRYDASLIPFYDRVNGWGVA